jgi:BirA family transcriptional regulator, biotin operon repressor / biotin---[acetyl-CoA-carboxylase] ligase
VDPVAKCAQLTLNLAGISRFTEIKWVAECTSTNTVLADGAKLTTEVSPGAILVTDRQTAGKGRLGRAWEAPVGASLAMSFRVPLLTSGGAALAHSAQFLGLLPLAVGMATRHAVLRLGVDPALVELKWPNDLMHPATGRKFAGVLCEAVGNQIIIGVGINLTRPIHVAGVAAERAHWVNEVSPGQLPVHQVEAATALAIELDTVLSTLLLAPEHVLTDIRQQCATLGRAIRVEQLTETWEGTAVGIHDSGALMVQRADTGQTAVVHAGDVIHLRSTP